MKTQQLKKLLLFFLVLQLGFSACKQEDLKKYTIEVELNFAELEANVPKEGHTVRLTNESKGIMLQVLTNQDGAAVFAGIEPGNYTISSSIQTRIRSLDRALNGYTTIEFTSDYSGIIDLYMVESARFVISQFYYSGCLSQAGKLDYSDQFIEIYNNTGETLYADGLSLVEHEARGDKENEWKDWESTHIVVSTIWTIPGTGKDVPVLPGKSLVIASNALNHKSDPNGNPGSPVDLGDADFEYHVWSESGRDIDYPAVPNLTEDLFVLRGTVSYFDVRGGSAMALVWLPEDKDTYIEANLLPMVLPNRTRYYCKIPNEFVEDAVEVVFSDRLYKRFDPSLDAGHVAVEAGSKSGLGIRRKVGFEINGRKVLKDSNNSSLDFEHDVVPKPRYFEFN